MTLTDLLQFLDLDSRLSIRVTNGTEYIGSIKCDIEGRKYFTKQILDENNHSLDFIISPSKWEVVAIKLTMTQMAIVVESRLDKEGGTHGS